ncbi:hypothetical protein CKY47_04375 [Saccharothrix yanglingensis]|uniref:Uncharacterized protein n=2 Tax=Saccharothrix yanglingensis TaxID=659496 RepID=A0ABU0WTS1_9PSEU|nr:hypothetical protein [Saccharothrix yanglingensis]
MSYEEKGTWVYLVVTLVTYGGYAALLLGRAGDDLAATPYVGLMIGAVIASMVLAIVVRILVEVVRPSDRHRADERDRDIDMRGEQVAGGVLGFGMILPLALAMAEAPHFWIANAIYAVFTAWAVATSAVKLVAYRRGF